MSDKSKRSFAEIFRPDLVASKTNDKITGWVARLGNVTGTGNTPEAAMNAFDLAFCSENGVANIVSHNEFWVGIYPPAKDNQTGWKFPEMPDMAQTKLQPNPAITKAAETSKAQDPVAGPFLLAKQRPEVR